MKTQCSADLLARTRDLPANDVLPHDVRRGDLLRHLSDGDLLRRTGELTGRSRHAEALLLAHLGEIDERRLYLKEACSSLFAFCTERLHFSGGEAFLRITAARAAREHPVILEMLADGRLHLSAVACLASHLTAANRDAVLSRAVHRSKREVEELVAELSPRSDVPTLIRKLPAPKDPVQLAAPVLSPTIVPALAAAAGLSPTTAPSGLAPRPAEVDRFDSPASPQDPLMPLNDRRVARATVEPLALGRYKVQFTASAELRDKLDRLRALMRSTVPDGDLAAIIEAAVSEKLARLEKVRSAATERPRKSLADTTTRASSRHLPAAVRRIVYARDGGQCAYRDAQGRRCNARERLEYHHRRPYGYGGDHSVDNVALLCPAHNRFLEEIDYGTTWRRSRRDCGGDVSFATASAAAPPGPCWSRGGGPVRGA